MTDSAAGVISRARAEQASEPARNSSFGAPAPPIPGPSIGEIVEHPQYGRGRITALYRNGAEWMVRFDSGLRFRRPRLEFNGQEALAGAGIPAPLPAPDVAPMPPGQFAARQLLETLRVGIAPVQHIQELTIGLAEERATVSAAITQAHQHGGDVRAVIGDYGHGKSHLVELAAQDALDRGFLAAATSLDLRELPAHRPFDIYAALLRNLRYPDTDDRGISALLAKARGNASLQSEFRELAGTEHDPLSVALYALDNITSTRRRQAWENWLQGGRRVTLMNRAMPPGVKFPSIYRIGQNARQIVYLLSGLSVLARLTGYSGLALLVDEAESYSLLTAEQRGKADLLFRALIRAASSGDNTTIDESEIPQHRWRAYPLTYRERQSLFFLFTITRSDNRLPLESWLPPERIIDLDSHHSPEEIGHFLQTVQRYHAQAYGYTAGERQGQIRRGAAEHLAMGVRNDKLSIRGVVRLAVELYDMLYLHPDYDAAAMLEELRTLLQ